MTGLESPMYGALRFTVQKGRTILSPQYQTPPGSLTREVDDGGWYGTTGVGGDLYVAAQDAVRAMVAHVSRPTACRGEDAYLLREPVRRPEDLGDRRRGAVHRQRAAAARRVQGVSAGPVDPAELGAAEAARRIAAGDLSSAALVAACLERIAEREETVRAWAHLDAGAALAQARERDAEPPARAAARRAGRGEGHRRHGGPADRARQRIHAGRRPGADAACVARLRAAGAVILGKTVTTEFAYFSPGPTRNPADPSRTPGGSSSGSAAAVGASMVPVALGSQTAGSVIRPAAYCGVLGLKPTRGVVDLTRGHGAQREPRHARLVRARTEDLALLGRVLAEGWPAARRPRRRTGRSRWRSRAPRGGTGPTPPGRRPSRRRRSGWPRTARACASSTCPSASRACRTPRTR